jgi:release factor glutamine methyltransferase
MRLQEALKQGVESLARGGVPSPRLNAEVLLMHAARCDRAHLFSHSERELTDAERVDYGRCLHERLQGKPTQYITGHQEFWGLDFLVNPSVLIPRPETELVVEAALQIIRRQDSEDSEKTEFLIADVGTGSGCIAIALAHELPKARAFALDQSPPALETARRNARRLGVEPRIQCLLSDLLVPCSGEPLPPLHMVVSNPPYVSEQDRNVMPEVRRFEPPAAVFAGKSGLEVYSRLIPQAAQALRLGGALVLELGYDVQEGVRGLLSPTQWDSVHWLPDLAGIMRVVTARRVR